MRASKFLTGIAGAVVLTLGISGVVAADTVVGQHGDYLFTDSSSTPGAACRYAHTASGNYVIYRIVVKPPSVWWPDTNSSITTQHGPVGWQAVIKYKTPSMLSFAVLKKSTVQHAIAYEDQLVPYGNSTKAPFTAIAINLNGLNFNQNTEFKAVARATWYSKTTGAVIGYVTHTVLFYRQFLGTLNFGVSPNPYCIDTFPIV